MGRGLSEIQKNILLLAFDRYEKRRADAESGPADLFHFEGLSAIYGWVASTDGNWGGNHFSREEIGAAEYNRKLASYSRAVRRLEERGLIEPIKRTKRGFRLTAEGYKVSAGLAENSEEQFIGEAKLRHGPKAKPGADRERER